MRLVLPWAVVVTLAGGLGTGAAPQTRASAAPQTEDPGEIPASYVSLKNPLPVSEENARVGAALWRSHCESCHGATGRGDGPNARLHELRRGHAPRDLTDPKLQENLTDGELFWRVSKGIVEDGDKIVMPAYERKLPEEAQRWAIVLHVRALGRRATGQE